VIGELLLGTVRLAHALAAALWVGGALIFVMAPGLARGIGGEDGRRLRESLRIGVAVFVLSGAIMTAERLGSAPLPPTYFAALGLKIGLAAWMFAVARGMGKAQAEPGARTQRLLVLGVVIYGLAMVLRSIYEHTIRS
jgi:hypothetical protein